MFDDFFLQFERPGWLLLCLLVLPTYLIARGSIGGLSALKSHVIFAIRSVVILLLAMALAKPSWLQRGEGLSVILLVDQSRSIPYELQRRADTYLQTAVANGMQKEDRLGVITFAGDSFITALPNRESVVNLSADIRNYEGTNIAEAIRLALAVFPKDTACRIVLVSDGNETADTALEASKVARTNDIPIDVLVLGYEHDREVIFDRLDVPARAREGQVSEVRMILRSQSEISGTLTLFQNGDPYDLDPGAPGDGVHVTLDRGPNRHSVPILFDQPGPQQFRAVFQPDEEGADVIRDNNAAVGVTFVAGEGKVLVVDDSTGVESEALVGALRESGISVDVKGAESIDSLVTLAGYDAVVLVNQPRYNFDDDQDLWLHSYVHDLGGGLVMTGGSEAFGAGAWIDSRIEKALPLELDPPQTIQRLRGALGLIMHSCEMSQGNYWGEKVAIAAIEALSSQDYIGIIDYNYQSGGAAWEFDKDLGGLNLAGDKKVALQAAKNMPVGDMPDFESSMKLMLNGMLALPGNASKHVIIISDGDPSPPTRATLQAYVDNKITVSTALVAGHGGPATMKLIAEATNGRYKNITNPLNLPEWYQKETRFVARSLIVDEGIEYVPQKIHVLSEPTTGYSSLPSVGGYVLTAPKEGLAEIAFVTDAHQDPLYAHWNYGLGKSIAFTSDLSGRWGAQWVQWDGFKGFWDQSIRWVMRPASPPNLVVKTTNEGDRAIVEVEAVDEKADFLNFLRVGAAVIPPEGDPMPLSLEQVGPGRYRGEFRTTDAGAYLINMNFSKDDRTLGNLQAAVNVPYSREFRDIKDNETKLRRIADETGGRILPEDASQANLWDRTGLVVRESPLTIWDLLAILAASIFVIDVAARRLSISVAEMRRTWDRAFGKRGESGTDTVAAWKKARSQVAHRREDAASETAPAVDRATKFEADEATSSTAFDVGADDDTESPRDSRAAPKRSPREPAPDPDEGDYTSRLLAAKRRANLERQGGGPDEEGGDG